MGREDEAAASSSAGNEQDRSASPRRPRKSKLAREAEKRWNAEQLERQHERERMERLEKELQDKCAELGLRLRKSDDPRSISSGLSGEYFLRLSDGTNEVDLPLWVERSDELTQFIHSLSRDMWLLSDYAGIVQVDAGYIEVIVENVGGVNYGSTYNIDTRLFAEAEGGLRGGRITAVSDKADLVVEISAPSTLFTVLDARIAPPHHRMAGPINELTTLKLSGIELRDRQHGEALLKSIAQSLAFDLETRFGRGFSLYPRCALGDYRAQAYRSVPGAKVRTVLPVRQPLRLTLNAYGSEATSYYWHAKKTESIPLAAYLGYYQVLEYHFQRYVRQDAINLVRRRLKDPRLDIDNDHDLARLIDSIDGEIRRRNSELQQLVATLSHCLDPEEIARFIGNDKPLSAHLSHKDRVPGVPPVSASLTGAPLVERVAERIYRLRCQIVHSKGESKGSEVFLLVPDSPAALSIQDDIKLVRFAAQSVIIASSGTLDLDRP